MSSGLQNGELQDLVPHEPFKCATEADKSYPKPDGVLRRPKSEALLSIDCSQGSSQQFLVSLGRSDQTIERKRLTLTVAPMHRSRSVQTDALAIDIESLCPLDDFRRSERCNGLRSRGNESERLFAAEEEVRMLRNQVKTLNAKRRGQELIHDDLKKLLIGSLGDDTYRQLFNLTSEQVRLNEENASLRQKIADLSDQLDRTAIEADMWRSKFVAGRVMLDELAGWKAQLSVRYQESTQALRQMLQERQQVRNDLCELYRLLASHDPKAAAEMEAGITNSVELGIANRQLARRIFGKGHNRNAASIRLPSCREYTTGERSAIDALGNQPVLTADNTMRYSSAFQSPQSKTFERLTLHSCKKCKGDVNVV